MRRILIPFCRPQLPWAVVAAEAALRGGADEVAVLVADADPPAPGTFAEGVRVVLPHEIDVSEDRIAVTAAADGTPATPRAIVPDALRALDGGDDAFVLLDPYTRVVGPLDSFWEALEHHASVVTPSLLDPHANVVPERRMGLERRPTTSPAEVLASHDVGSVSSAFLGIRPGRGSEILDGWPGRLGRPSHYDAMDIPRFEAWVDGLATLPAVHVLRDPGVGVGWFNLAERDVRRRDGRLEVDGSPLTLVDLRGHDPRRPNVLCPTATIGMLSEHPDLIDEVRTHSLALQQAGAIVDLDDGVLPQHLFDQGRWATLPSGDQLVRPLRNLYRKMVADGELTLHPFTPEGEAAMLELFCAPAPRGKPSGMNRFVWSLWVDRSELRDVYDKLEGSDGPGLVGWCWAYGRRELIPESVLPPMAERYARGDVLIEASGEPPETSRISTRDPAAGARTNVAGFFSAQLGLGESVRQLVHALRVADVDVTAVQGRLIPSGRGESDFVTVTPDKADHPISILMLNGDSIPEFAKEVGPDFFRDRYTIGFYWWEVDPYPADAWNPGLEFVDELWAGTEFVGDLLRRGEGVDVPVTVIRVPVAEPPPVTVDRAHFGLPEDVTLFGFVYDYESSGQRKNPLGLVQAYTQAFAPDDGAHLLLKSLGSMHRVADHEEVLVAAAGRPDITIIDRYLTTEEKDSLVGICDCYVSPHRSEGFGYTLAEAMAYGKPVVCTGYGGVLDFANENTARLVSWKPAVTGPFAIPYPPDSRWSDPDLEDLGRQMRWVHDNPQEAAALGRRAAEEIARTHSYAAAGASMRKRLEEIYRSLPPVVPVSAAPSANGHDAVAPRTLRRVIEGAQSVPGAGSALARARSTWWRLMDRAVASRTNPRFAQLHAESESLETAAELAREELEQSDRQLARRLEALESTVRAQTAQLASTEARLAEAVRERED